MLTANGTILQLNMKESFLDYLNVGIKKEKNYKLNSRKPKMQITKEIEYWDKRQLVKKINPNSLYGAILIPVVDF